MITNTNISVSCSMNPSVRSAQPGGGLSLSGLLFLVGLLPGLERGSEILFFLGDDVLGFLHDIFCLPSNLAALCGHEIPALVGLAGNEVSGLLTRFGSK